MDIVSRGPTVEVAQLQQRLAMVHEWHQRSEAQIAKLIQCADHTRSLRPRIESSELSIPLLKSYDDEIRKKSKELTDAQDELARTRSQLDVAVAEAREGAVSLRVVNEKAQAMVDDANLKLRAKLEEVATLRDQLAAAQREVMHARDASASGGAPDSPAMKEANKRLVKDLAAQETTLREVTAANAQLQRALDVAQAELASLKQQQQEDRNESEAQKVQLHLAARENDDKVQEIERLRDKMVHALKQSAENHATHLKLVEEKHRSVIETLRQEAKQHEMACAKLRAQLARVDVAGGGGGALMLGSASASRSLLSSASEAVETHARHALEIEVKRLYTELSSAQMQRDDAVLRFEQLSIQRRQEGQEALREAQRDAEMATLRAKELEDRNGRLESEVERLKDTVRKLREEVKSLQAERSREQDERAEWTKKLDEAKRSVVTISDELERTRVECKERVEVEVRNVRALERKLEDAKRDEASARERQLAEALDSSRTIEELRGQLRDAQDKFSAASATAIEKDRLIEAHGLKSERLTQGLAAHKLQLQQCEQRLGEMAQREAQLITEIRDTSLLLERSKLENARLARDRERLAAETKSFAATKRRSAA